MSAGAPSPLVHADLALPPSLAVPKPNGRVGTPHPISQASVRLGTAFRLTASTAARNVSAVKSRQAAHCCTDAVGTRRSAEEHCRTEREASPWSSAAGSRSLTSIYRRTPNNSDGWVRASPGQPLSGTASMRGGSRAVTSGRRALRHDEVENTCQRVDSTAFPAPPAWERWQLRAFEQHSCHPGAFRAS
jgi:hypothetical protein